MVLVTTFGEHEAVFSTGVPFDAGVEVGATKIIFETIHHFLWRIFVSLGAAEIHLACYRFRIEMWRIYFVRIEVDAMKGGASRYAFGKLSGSSERERPAHTITDAAHLALTGRGFLISKVN